jgi:uncharacterized protein YgbK (DUF1537 family)
MRRVLIIADDLTGACDSAVHFARFGLEAVVELSTTYGHEVCAVPTGSRDMLPEAARRTVTALLAKTAPAQSELIYKKIDSTLRGNFGAEIAAVLDATGRRIAIVAPAYPAMGRTFRNGRLSCSGVEQNGVPELVCALLEGGVPEAVHATADTLVRVLDEWTGRSGPVAVAVDAENDEDLQRIATLAQALAPSAMLAGSGGLAAHIAPLAAGAQASSPANLPKAAGPLLLAIGSQHPVTCLQIRSLLSAIPVTEADGKNFDAVWQRAAADSVVLLRAARTPGLLPPLLTQRLAENPPGAIFLSGGDTASAFCQLTLVERIRLEAEVASGVPCGRLMGGPLSRLPVLLKSGGFGAPELLVETVRFLQRK